MLKTKSKIKGGAEEKYQIDFEGKPAILKIDRYVGDRSRAWIEKIGAELAAEIGLPTATYELAQLDDGSRGILTPNFMLVGNEERSGLKLMKECFEENNYLYTVENVLAVFDRIKIDLPAGYNSPPEIQTAKELFIGYLIHDSWIDNPDRHDRNWGIQENNLGEKQLLPDYDYGWALTDFPVVNNRLDIYAERLSQSRTCAFLNNRNSKIKMDEMILAIAAIEPNGANYWSQKIARIGRERIGEIIDRIPDGWINATHCEFAKIFIEYNGNRLQSICSNSANRSARIDLDAIVTTEPDMSADRSIGSSPSIF